MNEVGKFEVYKKKLQGICEENDLIYSFKMDKYPITLTFQTTGSVGEQMSMLEKSEDETYRSPDAELVFAFVDGALMYRNTETFTISDALFGKLKNLFKNMHSLWLQYFFRDIVERGALPTQDMPVIEDDEDDDGDISSEAFDKACDDLQPLEAFEDDDDENGDSGADESTGYGYDEKGESDVEA